MVTFPEFNWAASRWVSGSIRERIPCSSSRESSWSPGIPFFLSQWEIAVAARFSVGGLGVMWDPSCFQFWMSQGAAVSRVTSFQVPMEPQPGISVFSAGSGRVLPCPHRGWFDLRAPPGVRSIRSCSIRISFVWGFRVFRPTSLPGWISSMAASLMMSWMSRPAPSSSTCWIWCGRGGGGVLDVRFFPVVFPVVLLVVLPVGISPV